MTSQNGENVTPPTDSDRMNWLERQTVQVRTPLRYGSRENFWASPDLEGPRSNLRSQIDRAMRDAMQIPDDEIFNGARP